MAQNFIASQVTNRRRRGISALCLGFLILISGGGTLAVSLTESESLRLGLEREAYRELLDSRQIRAESDLTAAKTWPNPQLELSREELGDETETAVWLRQAFDLSGRRGFSSQAAEAALEAVRLELDASRAERRAEILRLFHQTLYHQRREALIGRWLERYARVERSMRRREEAGDVSGYDRLRISRERDSLMASQREELMGLEAAFWKLRESLGLKEQRFDSLDGELLPDDPPDLGQVLENLPNQPGLQSLRYQSEAGHFEVQAARRAKVPELVLGLGHKQFDSPQGDESGLMLSAGFTLPLFDRGEAQRQKAASNWRERQSEYRLAQVRVKTEAERRWGQARQSLDNARLYLAQSLNDAHELLRIAETAYENNELGVLELIDAYRSALDADLNALRLALEARLNRIELDSLRAGVMP